MSLILDGTNGLSDVDGSAATPAIRGTDTNTGIFFPAADTIAFAEGGAEVARFDSSGNLGVNTTTPNTRVQSTVGSSGSGVVNALRLQNLGTSAGDGAKIVFTAGTSTDGAGIASTGVALNSADLRFYAGGNTERMRLASDGNLLVGTTGNATGGRLNVAGTWPQNPLDINITSANASASASQFFFNGSNCGLIVCTSSTTSYNTSSDYRLKENIAPMTGALAKVSALKPVTYTWKADGSDGQGFIAHELQEVCPDAVTGEKDAVETYTDEDGNEQTRIKPQGIDTSFLVATLTAAIQELKAELDSVKAELATLKA